jgi:hypothetical protein
MQPNIKQVTIHDNLNLIKKLLNELVLQPRLNAIRWSAITKQTPNIKIGYPGQHLASLIAGMEGERTGARGNDLIDGSEVKSCSRIDQLDICRGCEAPVARIEEICSSCTSSDIDRKNDSKWLFTIRNEDDLNSLVHGVKRVFLVIGDYPNFDESDFDTLRFQSFEIWPESKRNARFGEIMENYYRKIYLAHKKKTPTKTPAPKNFWPYQYQFYVCNPILTFSCTVKDANKNPRITIDHYTEPADDRSRTPSIMMPVEILTDGEVAMIYKKAQPSEIARMLKTSFRNEMRKIRSWTIEQKRERLEGIDETLRSYLPLRDTDKISTAKNKYSRRTH